MLDVGIDLGTTYSTIAHVNPHGSPVLFPDAHDASLFRTPSVVHIGENGALVGTMAEDLLDDDPDIEVTSHAKLGLGQSDPLFHFPGDHAWTAGAICALILRKIVRDAERFSNEEVRSAVIAVPAQWRNAARKATRDAALIAGLRQVSLIEEPVAAATYYGNRVDSDPDEPQTFLVYDFGGGTFDATIIEHNAEGLAVLATHGRRDVGGKDLDEVIARAIAEDFRRKHAVDMIGRPADMRQLRRRAQELKIKMAQPHRKQLRRAMLLCGRPYEFFLTRAQFDAMAKPLIEATLNVCETCLADANLGWEAIDKVMLTGGSALIPAVQEAVGQAASVAGKASIVLQDPHMAVGYGAALIATQRAGDSALTAPSVLKRISSYHLGVRIRNPSTGELGVKPLIKRGTPLPAEHTAPFYTTRADQERLVLEIVQARTEDEEGAGLGFFVFGPIENPHRNYRIDVTVAYDIDGIVKVTAHDHKTKAIVEHEIVRKSEQREDIIKQLEYVKSLPINE